MVLAVRDLTSEGASVFATAAQGDFQSQDLVETLGKIKCLEYGEIHSGLSHMTWWSSPDLRLLAFAVFVSQFRMPKPPQLAAAITTVMTDTGMERFGDALGVIFLFNMINRVADARQVPLEYSWLRVLGPAKKFIERRFVDLTDLLYDLSPIDWNSDDSATSWNRISTRLPFAKLRQQSQSALPKEWGLQHGLHAIADLVDAAFEPLPKADGGDRTQLSIVAYKAFSAKLDILGNGTGLSQPSMKIKVDLSEQKNAADALTIQTAVYAPGIYPLHLKATGLTDPKLLDHILAASIGAALAPVVATVRLLGEFETKRFSE